MSNKDRAKQVNFLESPTGISELLKSVAHPVRIRVLSLLSHGERGFSELMSQTGLSKTALANHLNRLVKMNLAGKVGRGRYALTRDGEELFKAVATVYQNSAQRAEKLKEALRNRYTKCLIEGKTLNRKLISKRAVYQPCWLSYTGAMAGSLTSLGTKCDIVDVGGYSGYAFVINVSKGVTCPSGPTALSRETWMEIHKATENLGWTLEHYEHPDSFPLVEGKHTPEEIEIARKLFTKIKREINEQDKPVVLWGLVAPEYGIVNGYEAESYLASTFRHLNKQSEDPIIFYDLRAPGCLEAFFFRNKVKLNRDQLDKMAVERAVRFTEAKVSILDNYVAGPTALNEWANALENLPKKEQNYHGNSYVAACVWEGRAIAGKFLERIAKKHANGYSGHLLAAAQCYKNGVKHMEEFMKIFPFKFQGEMKSEDRKSAAELLRKVKPLEEEAIQHMRSALASWEKQ